MARGLSIFFPYRFCPPTTKKIECWCKIFYKTIKFAMLILGTRHQEKLSKNTITLQVCSKHTQTVTNILFYYTSKIILCISTMMQIHQNSSNLQNHCVLLLGDFKIRFLYLQNFQLQTEIGDQWGCRKMEQKLYKISGNAKCNRKKIFSKDFNITVFA